MIVMKFLGGSVLIVALVFLGTAFSYVGGRIICPELGLSVPDYMTWFWFNLTVVTGGTVVHAIGGVAFAAIFSKS